MLSNKVTVCIFAWNEEKRIRDAILDLQKAFRILVVDNHSTDSTVHVCQEMGIEVISIKNPGFVENDVVMRQLQDVVETDYILCASVSEIIPFPLLLKYAEVANCGSHDVVRAFRISITNGQPIPLSGNLGIRHPGELRFFRKGSVDFRNNKVHDRGRPLPKSKVLKLPQREEFCFVQFRDYDVSKTELANRSYNDILAYQRFQEGQRFRWLPCIYYTLKQVFNPYLRFGVWRYGMLGFIHCLCWGWSEFSRWLRLWEWETSNDMSNVLKRNEEVRKSIRENVRFQLSVNSERGTT